MKRSHSELLGLLEHVYMGQAYGAWFFFAYPARRRLPEGEAERLIEAGIGFRALWLLLDHLVDLEEDRRNNVVTGVRLAIDSSSYSTSTGCNGERHSEATYLDG